MATDDAINPHTRSEKESECIFLLGNHYLFKEHISGTTPQCGEGWRECWVCFTGFAGFDFREVHLLLAA